MMDIMEVTTMKKTVPEFLKMQNIPENSEINLWFEDDLFCQVTFWFYSFIVYIKASIQC